MADGSSFTGGANQVTCDIPTSTTTVNVQTGSGLATGTGVGGGSGGGGSPANIATNGGANPGSNGVIGSIDVNNLAQAASAANPIPVSSNVIQGNLTPIWSSSSSQTQLLVAAVSRKTVTVTGFHCIAQGSDTGNGDCQLVQGTGSTCAGGSAGPLSEQFINVLLATRHIAPLTACLWGTLPRRVPGRSGAADGGFLSA
jgi:hypothetical protein